ncbi:MAG: type II toxin-antitoxin system HicB family antitoxin [Acidobacteriota bacterium]|nr:type II toxin-antitoxin system HicB family antitoxin [Acidobacteriota bacterium]
MKRVFTYTAIFRTEGNVYVVEFPYFEGIYTFGDSLEEARRMAKEALELVILHYIDQGEELKQEQDFFELQEGEYAERITVTV